MSTPYHTRWIWLAETTKTFLIPSNCVSCGVHHRRWEFLWQWRDTSERRKVLERNTKFWNSPHCICKCLVRRPYIRDSHYLMEFVVIVVELFRWTQAAFFQDVLEIYHEDLLGRGFATEFISWRVMWKLKTCSEVLSSSIRIVLNNCLGTMFPNIWRLVQIFVVIPVIVASNERHFSLLRRIKTYLCTCMANKRLIGLTMMAAYQRGQIDPKAVVDDFCRLHRHKTKLIAVLLMRKLFTGDQKRRC